MKKIIKAYLEVMVVIFIIMGSVKLLVFTITLVFDFPSLLQPGEGELSHSLFIECMNTANAHQDSATTLSTTESETSEVVDSCKYYANKTASLMLRTSTND